MPIYAYKCDACGHAKDALQKISDLPLTTCPACGASAFKKQLTSAGFQLKGSGWYVTDFKNGNSGATAAKKEDAAAPGTADTGDSKSATAADTGVAAGTAATAAAASTTPAAPAASPVSSGSAGTSSSAASSAGSSKPVVKSP